MYHKMIRNEFKAHNDSITCFTIIKEPLCFVTGGKDKFVKIWDLNCNCLGVINALPKLSKVDGELPPWTFKINEEKILEDEIAEVVGIFEGVGVEPIEVGSKMDKEVDKIEVREKVEVSEAPKKEVAQFIKRKFKKLEKRDKHSKNVHTDENKANLSYEGFYVQNAQKNIENLLEEQVPNIGINEITRKFIDNVVDNEKGKRKIKKLTEQQNEKEMVYNQDNNDKNKYRYKKSVGFTNKKTVKLDNFASHMTKMALNKFDFQPINKNQNNIIFNNINLKRKQTNTLLYNLKKKDSNLSSNKEEESNNNILTGLYISSKSNNIYCSSFQINNLKKKPKPLSFIDNMVSNVGQTGQMGLMGQALTNINEESRTKYKNYSMSLKKKKSVGRNNNKFRNTFYSEKLFGKTATSMRTEIDKKNEKMKCVNKFKRNLSNLHLPYLNENFVFQKGETEKLLNLHFYKTSYRACCEITKQNDMPNTSIQKNFQNNWRLVEQYAKDIKNRKNIITKKNRNASLNYYNRPKPILKTTSPSTEF